MEPKKRESVSRYIKIAIILLAVSLVSLVVFLVRDYLSLRRADFINRREISLSAFIQKHGPLTASDVGVLRPWMTFDYANKLFALPEGYLKDQLQISDTRYPNLTLGSYASMNKVDPAEAMVSIENAIVHYLNQTSL